MATVTRCDACNKIETTPINWWQIQPFGRVSVNAPRLTEPVQLCSIECVAVWAEAHKLAFKREVYRKI
jgi:hypothetical protein